MDNTAGEDVFDCFGSDSESSEVDTSLQEEEEHLLQLLQNVKIKQLASESAKTLLPLNCPLDFEVFDTKDAGAGMRAMRPFACGDEILREGAVLRVPNQQAASTREEAEALHSQAVGREFQRLSSPTQQAVLNLSNCHSNGKEELSQTQQLLGVYQTNSFLLGGGQRQVASQGNNTRSTYDQNYGGLFLTVARMNHSCRPNANHIWRPDLQQTLVFATRDIQVGEEICTTYGPSHECLDTAGRRSYLAERFSFDCGCDMCLQGNSLGGDDRMTELNARLHEISLALSISADDNNNSNDGDSGVKEILASVEKCLTLLQEQGFGVASGAFVKHILHCGYQASLLLERDQGGSMLKDPERLARSYLSRELVATEHGEGVGSPNALKLQAMIDAL